MNPSQPPSVIARMQNNELAPRAETKHVFSKTVPFDEGVRGEVTLDIFRSTDIGDRGGVVLRITSKGPSGDIFVAHAQPIDGGIEVHMAGEAEGRALLDALREGIAEMKLVTEVLKTDTPPVSPA